MSHALHATSYFPSLGGFSPLETRNLSSWARYSILRRGVNQVAHPRLTLNASRQMPFSTARLRGNVGGLGFVKVLGTSEHECAWRSQGEKNVLRPFEVWTCTSYGPSPCHASLVDRVFSTSFLTCAAFWVGNDDFHDRSVARKHRLPILRLHSTPCSKRGQLEAPTLLLSFAWFIRGVFTSLPISSNLPFLSLQHRPCLSSPCLWLHPAFHLDPFLARTSCSVGSVWVVG